MWSIENIPDEDLLYKRIYENHISGGEVKPITFEEHGAGDEKGMSTDWAKHSSPEETKYRARKPEKNGVVSFVTGDLRNLKLEVIHAPIIITTHIKNKLWIKNNRAHTNVKGIDTEVRLKLLDLFKWEVKLSGP